MEFYKYKGVLFKIVDELNPNRLHRYVLWVRGRDGIRWLNLITLPTIKECIQFAELFTDKFNK